VKKLLAQACSTTSSTTIKQGYQDENSTNSKAEVNVTMTNGILSEI